MCWRNLIRILSRLLTNLLGDVVVPPLVGVLVVSDKAEVDVVCLSVVVVGKLCPGTTTKTGLLTSSSMLLALIT